MENGLAVAIAAEVLEDAISALLAGAIAGHSFTYSTGPALPRGKETLRIAFALVSRKAFDGFSEVELLVAVSFPIHADHTLRVVRYSSRKRVPLEQHVGHRM